MSPHLITQPGVMFACTQKISEIVAISEQRAERKILTRSSFSEKNFFHLHVHDTQYFSSEVTPYVVTVEVVFVRSA